MVNNTVSVIVLIDWDNIRNSTPRPRIDYKRLYEFFSDRSDGDISFYLFAGISTLTTQSDSEFLERLESIGYTIVRVQGTGHKANVDVSLTLTAAEHIFTNPNLNLIVLLSGDRDFIPLLVAARHKKISCVVAAVPNSLSLDLKWTANEFYDLNLLTEVHTQTPVTRLPTSPSS